MHELSPAEVLCRLSSQPGSLLFTPPSTTGKTGVISKGTLERVAALRAWNLPFVLVTGARLSTLLMRLPFLPAADAYVCESGGRIFLPGGAGSLPTAVPLKEDEQWRARLNAVVGPPTNDVLAAADRQGVLWEWMRSMAADGFAVDGAYSTSFTVHCKNGKTHEDIIAAAKSMPGSLKVDFNLGRADFFPAASGKLNAAKHLMTLFGATPATSTFLCDDDNDMELAAAVSRAFLPSITAASVSRAVAADPPHFVRADKTDTAASEEMLSAVAAYYGLPAQTAAGCVHSGV